MDVDQLNRRDAEIQAHALRAIRAAKDRKLNRREFRAEVAEALRVRDDMRGDMLRAFLRSK
jgi:hypothetical protein